jgi:hypothetical protein
MASLALIDRFDHRGVTAVDVHANAPARALYEALGFSDPAARPMRRRLHVRESG